MAISTFLQQLESELAGKPEALAVVEQYRPALEQADTQKNKDGLILLQDQMHAALAVALSAPVDLAKPVGLLPTAADAPVIGRFREWIEKLPSLTPLERNKLFAMADGYALSTQIASQMDPSMVIEPLKEVLATLMVRGEESLKEIAQFNEPTFIITPKKTLDEKKMSMDANKKYEGQGDMYILEDNNSPYRTIKYRSSASISVVDGAPHMDHIDGIPDNSKFSDRRELFKKHYEKKNMKLISSNEYAMLMQRSLHLYERSRDEDPAKILDFYKNKTDPLSTMTCFDDSDLARSSDVAYGCFYSDGRRVEFDADVPNDTNAYLRGRPSVQLMYINI